MKNIDNFFFPSENLEESRHFYSELLNMPIKFNFSQQGMIAFNIGKDEPALILKDKSKFPETKPCIWIEVANVKELYLKLKSKGVNFLSEPFKIKTGWAVEFFDPSGNQLGFTDYICD